MTKYYFFYVLNDDLRLVIIIWVGPSIDAPSRDRQIWIGAMMIEETFGRAYDELMKKV